MTRHLLDIDDLTAAELDEVLALAVADRPEPLLAGRGAALLFEKPSNRTRHSTEMAVVQLGGHPVYVRPDEVGIDTRETAEDIARTLSCFHGAIAARVFDHGVLERMATVATVPVVNLLSDRSHPLQAVADLLTLRAEFGPDLAGRRLTWVGDYSNVARSLGLAAALSGMELGFACPDGYDPPAEDLARFDALGGRSSAGTDPAEQVEGSHVVVTDAWYSMGQEAEKTLRQPIFEPYRVDAALLGVAADDAVFLHCLPAHRGDEVTDEVLDGPRSRVWVEAANRLPAARGVLEWLVARSEGPA